MPISDAHRAKFANFIEMLAETKGKADAVVVDHPEVLGDNYEELVTNLGLLADSKLALLIASS